jgi:hypothetical protein
LGYEEAGADEEWRARIPVVRSTGSCQRDIRCREYSSQVVTPDE